MMEQCDICDKRFDTKDGGTACPKCQQVFCPNCDWRVQAGNCFMCTQPPIGQTPNGNLFYVHDKTRDWSGRYEVGKDYWTRPILDLQGPNRPIKDAGVKIGKEAAS